MHRECGDQEVTKELYSKTCQSPTVPQRIVLKPNLHYGRQDTTSSDARTFSDHSDKHKEKLWRRNVQGNLSRWNRLQKPMIAPFSCPRAWTHPQESSPKSDSPVREPPEQRSIRKRPKTESRIQSIQRAVEGNDLQHGNHGVLEDLRDHSNIHCTNCLPYWPKGIVCCTCGTCLRPSDKVRKLNSDRCDVLSIPNCVMKKGPVPWGTPREHGKAETLPCSACLFQKGRRRRGSHQCGIDSWSVLFIDDHKWTSGGPRIAVHTWMRL